MHISLDSALGRQRRLNSVGESALQIAPGATAAYSLRSLTGGDPVVVRVRRSSDDAEADFRVSEITSGALITHVGSGNDGFVSIWYDQSGNNKHATQEDSADKQPKIVISGSLVPNGLDFDGSNDELDMPSTIISNINSASAFLVSKDASGFAFGIALSLSAGSGTLLDVGAHLATNLSNRYGGAATTFGSADGAKHLTSLVVGDSNAESFQDGISKGTISTVSGYSASGTIGSSGSLFYDGQIEEVIIYDSDQGSNRVALETNIQSAYPTLP
jgi:hypothetical protein